MSISKGKLVRLAEVRAIVSREILATAAQIGKWQNEEDLTTAISGFGAQLQVLHDLLLATLMIHQTENLAELKNDWVGPIPEPIQTRKVWKGLIEMVDSPTRFFDNQTGQYEVRPWAPVLNKELREKLKKTLGRWNQ